MMAVTAKKQERTGSIQVRMVSNPQELQRVQAFRYAVLVGDSGFDGDCVDHARKTVCYPRDRTASHLYVLVDGRIAAVMRMLPGSAAASEAELEAQYDLGEFQAFPNQALSFTDQLVVAKAYAASKIPSLLSAAAFKLSRNSGAMFDFTHTAPALVGLYEKLGYRRYTDNFDDVDLGLQVPMILVMDDLDHLATLKSPFAGIAREFPIRREAANWFRRSYPEACAHAAKSLRNEDRFWNYLTDRLNQNPLHGIPMFSGLDYREALRFLRNSTVLKLSPGDALMRAGEVGNEMYVLLSGMVTVTAPDSDAVLARFNRGAVLGEVAYLSTAPRTATVAALDDCEVLVMTQAILKQLMDDTPELAAKVLFNLSLILCERLRTTNLIVQDMS
tara:strand:- start:5 stop:1168 length:1164 start_codon:yes stop_codon:yes gene_type:complete